MLLLCFLYDLCSIFQNNRRIRFVDCHNEGCDHFWMLHCIGFLVTCEMERKTNQKWVHQFRNVPQVSVLRGCHLERDIAWCDRLALLIFHGLQFPQHTLQHEQVLHLVNVFLKQFHTVSTVIRRLGLQMLHRLLPLRRRKLSPMPLCKNSSELALFLFYKRHNKLFNNLFHRMHQTFSKSAQKLQLRKESGINGILSSKRHPIVL
mmetsp:Transcript_2976/g.11395  ORF Transcript_2976/g.11395 Transcript_2976/m.11395 type:complete len:205 (-) Transcript_2976:225-839(-)